MHFFCDIWELHGGCLQQKGSWGHSVWSLHVLPVYMQVSSGCSGFLPLPLPSSLFYFLVQRNNSVHFSCNSGFSIAKVSKTDVFCLSTFSDLCTWIAWQLWLCKGELWINLLCRLVRFFSYYGFMLLCHGLCLQICSYCGAKKHGTKYLFIYISAAVKLLILLLKHLNIHFGSDLTVYFICWYYTVFQ